MSKITVKREYDSVDSLFEGGYVVNYVCVDLKDEGLLALVDHDGQIVARFKEASKTAYGYLLHSDGSVVYTQADVNEEKLIFSDPFKQLLIELEAGLVIETLTGERKFISTEFHAPEATKLPFEGWEKLACEAEHEQYTSFAFDLTDSFVRQLVVVRNDLEFTEATYPDEAESPNEKTGNTFRIMRTYDENYVVVRISDMQVSEPFADFNFVGRGKNISEEYLVILKEDAGYFLMRIKDFKLSNPFED